MLALDFGGGPVYYSLNFNRETKMAQANEITVKCPICKDVVELAFDNDGFTAYNVDLAPHNAECDAALGLSVDHPTLVTLAEDWMSECYWWGKNGGR